ncbi:MAG: aminopeptidase P family N-terminal domain-containing protein [Candidatus Dormibacteraceae bacterium]
MASSRMSKLSDTLRENKIDHALLTSLASVRYFAGHTAPIEIGPSPFAPLAGALAWVKDEEPALLLADSESAEDVAAKLNTQRFPGYTYDRPLRSLEELTTLLVHVFRRVPSSTVGVELTELPAFVLENLRSNCSQLNFQDVTSRLAGLRVIKEQEEIEAIRSALELCDLGQATVKKRISPGMT